MPLTAPKPIAAAVAATKPSLGRCRIVFSPPLKYLRRVSVSRDPRDDTDEPLSHASRFRERAIAVGLAHRPGDMVAESRPLAEATVPRLEPRQLGPLDRIDVPAMRPDAKADIGQGESVTGEVVAAVEPALDHRPQLAGAAARGVERPPITLLGRRAGIAPQQGAPRRRERRQVPGHPPVGMGALPPIPAGQPP